MSSLCKLAAISAAACLAISSHAHAINIVLTFDDTNSLTPDFDSDGSQLTAIMEAVEDYWEGVILDTQTINVTYRYEDLSANGLGNHDGTAFSGSVETGMTLRFDTAFTNGDPRNWYFDPTPTNNSEFNLQPTLYRDLNASNQVGGGSAWYKGSPQDQFEVAFQGGWIGTNQGVDLFTVALHEVGHGLGLTSDNTASVLETLDSDYDLPTSLTDGQTIAVNTSGTSANQRAHIAPTNALMFPSYQTGRALPTYSDVLSMASVSGWSQIDLQRKYFASGSNFQTAGNWIGNRAPDSFDDVFLLSGSSVFLSSTTFLNSLTLEEGNSLDADDEILFTQTDLNVAARPGAGGSAPTLSVDTSGLVSVNRDMNVAGGTIFLSGGDIAVGRDLNFSDVDSHQPAVIGYGELRVYNQLDGDADYYATGGQTLEVVNSGPSQSIEVGRLLAATSGDIAFTDFDEVELQTGAQLVIGPNRTMSINNLDIDPSIGSTNLPDIDFNGTPGNPTLLVLTGTDNYIKADVDISSYARVQGNQNWGYNANVRLPNADDILALDGPTEFTRPTFSGDGTLILRGDLHVTDRPIVETKYFDWDGDGITPVNTQINAYDKLTINSSQIEPIGFDTGYDGIATVYGQIEVNTYLELINPFGGPPTQVPDRWKLNPAGIISLQSTAGDSPYVGGSGVEVFGTVEAFGNVSGISGMALESGGIVNVNDSTANLKLWGQTRLRGGILLGLGTLTNRGDLYIDTSMSIDTQTFQWSETNLGSITIGDGYTFTINSPTLNENNDPLEGVMHVGAGSTLTVASSGIAQWNNEATITLDGGQINGIPIHNYVDGVIEGNGLIFGTTFTNDGTLRPNNEGLIRIHTTGTPDLDGAHNNGQIDVTDGDFFAKSLNPLGPVDVNFHGTIFVDGGFSFATNSSINFTLLGEIYADGGVIDVANFLNEGTIHGDTEFYNNYIQAPTGTLALEIGSLFNFDQLYADGFASLAGALEITFTPGYTPILGDSFTVLTANGITGSFDTILAPAGFAFDVTYPDGVDLELTVIQAGAALPGDLDGDGFVGINDLNIVLANWNQNVPPANPLADPSGDGFVGIDDLNEVLGNWNAGTPPVNTNNIPEPSTILSFLCLASYNLTRRR